MPLRALNRPKVYSVGKPTQGQPWSIAATNKMGEERAIRIKTFGLLGIVSFFVLTVLFAPIILGSDELDKDLCQRGGQPPAHAVMLLDPTDPLSPSQVQALRNEIRNRKEALRVGERLSILEISPDGDGPVARVLFSKCRPRDGTDAQALTENKRQLQKRYREQFEEPFEKVVAGIKVGSHADTSPLLASLYQIATMRSFASGGRRILIIISDLLELSQVMTQYRSPYRFSDPQVQESLYVKGVKGALAGVDVLVLERTDNKTRQYQTAMHENFWREYMDFAGVTNSEVRKF